MLSRLRGLVQALKAQPPEAQELLPNWDLHEQAPVLYPQSAAASSGGSSPGSASAEVEQTGKPRSDSLESSSARLEGAGTISHELSGRSGQISSDVGRSAHAVLLSHLCPQCQSPRQDSQSYCDNCGLIFAAGDPLHSEPAVETASQRLMDRYVLGKKLGVNGNVVRYEGLDYGTGSESPIRILVVQELRTVCESRPFMPDDSPDRTISEPLSADSGVDGTVETAPALDSPLRSEPEWPGLAWQCRVVDETNHACLPRVLDRFNEAAYDYAILEIPAGIPLWDHWDNPDLTSEERFSPLIQIAEMLQKLHAAGAMLEGLRPEILVVAEGGQARVTDIADLLPIPLPANAPIRANYYSAPELILASEQADARADLYSFGAMLYALHVGRELTDLDFELQGVPRSFLQRFPDVHPLFGRLVTKTFCRDPRNRFPTDEAAVLDPTGMTELLRTLRNCSDCLDVVRLDIAAWTTTGIVRAGNEDALSVLHSMETREDHLDDAVLILLADGMGGYEAGELAAAMAMQTLRKNLVLREPFTVFAGESRFSLESPATEKKVDIGRCKELMAAALKDANRVIFAAARESYNKRGMGCTAEVVHASGRHLLVSHVGDSRTYQLHRGTLKQVTKDQTWVNRMVKLGALSAEDAENHPRRSELQQALGGIADVDPDFYESRLVAGDWVVVCSDGLPNHIRADHLKEVLLSSSCAEAAARRLVNLANLDGATDNATVVVVRAS